EQFVARLTSHAVTQSANLAASDVEFAHVEELQLRRLSADYFGHQSESIRALNLEAVGLAIQRVGAGSGALVAYALGVVAFGFAVELYPVQHGSAADQVEGAVWQMHQDHVAYHVAVGGNRGILLGNVYWEVFEAVGAEVTQQFQCFWAGYVHIRHVI